MESQPLISNFCTFATTANRLMVTPIRSTTARKPDLVLRASSPDSDRPFNVPITITPGVCSTHVISRDEVDTWREVCGDGTPLRGTGSIFVTADLSATYKGYALASSS
ncbi:hypothetical protein M0R45_013285 [Rubus argutus]|uniref:Uncharacterized protein n=1 Tax=Rubus argutus TaxID=59490 RepID=A0AAW1XIP7_RUBAR